MDCSLHWHRTPTEEPAPTQDVVATRIYQALGVSDQIASSLVIDEFRDSLSGRYTCLLTCGEALGSTSADIYQKEKASKFRREKGVVGTENLVGIVVVVCSVLVCAGLVLFLTRPAAPSVPRGRRPGLTTLAAAVENGGLEQNGQTPDIPPSYSFVYPSTEATSGGNESSPAEGSGSTNRQSASRDRRKITSTESLETEACSTPSSSTTLPPDYTHALNELKAQGLVSSPLILATPPPAYESVGPGVRGGGYVPVNLESDEPVTSARGNHRRS